MKLSQTKLLDLINRKSVGYGVKYSSFNDTKGGDSDWNPLRTPYSANLEFGFDACLYTSVYQGSAVYAAANAFMTQLKRKVHGRRTYDLDDMIIAMSLGLEVYTVYRAAESLKQWYEKALNPRNYSLFSQSVENRQMDLVLQDIGTLFKSVPISKDSKKMVDALFGIKINKVLGRDVPVLSIPRYIYVPNTLEAGKGGIMDITTGNLNTWMNEVLTTIKNFDLSQCIADYHEVFGTITPSEEDTVSVMTEDYFAMVHNIPGASNVTTSDDDPTDFNLSEPQSRYDNYPGAYASKIQRLLPINGDPDLAVLGMAQQCTGAAVKGTNASIILTKGGVYNSDAYYETNGSFIMNRPDATGEFTAILTLLDLGLCPCVTVANSDRSDVYIDHQEGLPFCLRPADIAEEDLDQKIALIRVLKVLDADVLISGDVNPKTKTDKQDRSNK